MTEGLYEKAIKPLLDELYLDINKFAFNKDGGDKFNFAIIKKSSNNITYEEFWILSNCYYNYDTKKFNTINTNKPCFGIQIQANGTYPGEEAYDTDNIGINVWRHAKSTTNTSWDTFGVTSGWYNAFMLDSYGGMTIGGLGFEIDGNGIYPFTRLTSSGYKDSNNNEYYLLGLLDNAYHPTTYSSWQMDDNSTYAWFFGLRTPKKSNASGPIKNNNDTEFVIMYNDTPFTTENNKHNLNVGKWHTVFATNINGIKTINKLQTNYKGKNVVVDSVTGDITFEDLPTLSDLSTGEGELSIDDINGLADAIEASFKPQIISNFTSAQVRTQAAGGNLGSAFTELFRQSGRTIDENTIYFIPNNDDDLSSYDEFLYMPSINRFELIGSTQITLPTIADNLTTNDSTKVLSAKQGYNLEQNKLNNKFTDINKKGKNLVTDSSTGEVIFEAKNNHQHSEYVNPTIADNLTTNDSTKVLSAKQGYNLEENKLDKKQTNYKGKNVVVDSVTGDITFEEKNNHTHSQYLTSHQSLKDIAKINTVHSILTAQADNTILAEGDIYTLMEDMDKTRTTGQLYTESYFMTGQSNNSITIDEYKYGYNIITVNLGNIAVGRLTTGYQAVIQTSIDIPPSYKNITFDGTTDTGNSDVQIKIDTQGVMYATLTRKGTTDSDTHSLTVMGLYVPI